MQRLVIRNNPNIYFIKTDVNGLISDVGVHNDGNEIRFELYQNYPNPFNPSTKIKYSIPSITLRQAQSDIHVSLKVFDVLGNEIETLVNEEKPVGTYEVTWYAQ
ncbi:MAG: hypothetical protein MUE64_07945, partial [Ignavibacteriaceae bacterium]|nr:hypothetical protein [Ignavibacteriaceae bacterium]